MAHPEESTMPGRRPAWCRLSSIVHRPSSSLLILDVYGPRIQPQDFRDRRAWIVVARLVELLPPHELHWLRLDPRAKRAALQVRRTEPVHVHHHLHARVELDVAGVGDALAREAVHDEHLGRELVSRDEVLQEARGIVHVLRVVRADLLSGESAFLHGELGVCLLYTSD